MSHAIDLNLRSDVIRQLVRRVHEVPAEREPFPHFSIQGFLPESVYQELLALLPDPESYEPFGYEKHNVEGVSNRRRFRLDNDWLDRLPAKSRRFWYTLRSALGSSGLKRAVYESLSSGLSFRYAIPEERVAELPGFALPELFHETEGYSIKPHPDTRKKVVTMQLSLASDDSQEGMGTEFYRRAINPTRWLQEPRGFEIVKRMPFLPNTVYAFVVLNTFTLKSWHGRTSLARCAQPRNSLLNIWYARPEHGNRDLVAETAALESATPLLRSA